MKLRVAVFNQSKINPQNKTPLQKDRKGSPSRVTIEHVIAHSRVGWIRNGKQWSSGLNTGYLLGHNRMKVKMNLRVKLTLQNE